MAFLVLEEKRLFNSNVIQFSSCFLCQQLVEENGVGRGWSGSGAASGASLVSNWNHLGPICGVPHHVSFAA